METTRKLALTALNEIWERASKPKNVLDYLSGPLEARDRAFLMELVYGVVRFRDTLDWALKRFVKKPSGLSPATLNNLRLAAYQILFMRVPPRAAVYEAVEIEKGTGKPEVVNAVLRNLLRLPEGERLNFETVKRKGAVPHISLQTSHPRWLVKRWVRRFGEEEAATLAKANNLIPPLTLRVNTLKATREEVLAGLSETGIRAVPTAFSPDGIRLKDLHSFKELPDLGGLFIAQDEAAQLVTRLVEPLEGERVLDACAAPGGKTTYLAQMMGDKGEITAVDNDEKRVALIRENISRLGIKSVKIIADDVRDCSFQEPFDRILLDAPCSSLGVIRRNPDVKYRHAAGDLLLFRDKQAGLLKSVAGFLKPGGILVYSVCSTEPEEGEEVIKEFLKDSEDFYIIDTSLPFLKGFVKDGFFRTYPHRHDMDGFFGVRLCRKA